jgi:hypothetical protein
VPTYLCSLTNFHKWGKLRLVPSVWEQIAVSTIGGNSQIPPSGGFERFDLAQLPDTMVSHYHKSSNADVPILLRKSKIIHSVLEQVQLVTS